MGNNSSSEGSDEEEPLNLVLLGDNNKWKSLVGDAILGRNIVSSWRVNQCVKVQEKVNGRLVTVVQTPIWTGSLHTTPATVQGEIKRSMAHCSDGPLAFVLVVSIESDFTWESRVAVEEHMELISSSVWEYTFLLLITDKQERQRDPTDTHFINQRRDKKNLTWLLDKCGGRCFVFNRIDCNKEQVRDFMLQTHDVVKEHDQIHEHFRSVDETLDGQQVAELRLVLLGCSEDEKRAAGNTILGKEAFISKDILTCERHRGEVVGRKISIVNTPDQLVSLAGQSEVSVEQEVRRCLLLSSPGPHTFLLVLPIRGFTDEEKGVLQAMEELFGRTVFNHTIILFTHTYAMTQETLQLYLQEKRPDLQQLLEKCGNRHYLLSCKKGGNVTELLEKIEEMKKEQECIFVKQDIEERLTERQKQREEKRMEKCREEEEHRRKQKEASEKMELMRKDLEEKLKNSMELFTQLQLEMKQMPTDERARNQEMELLLKDHQEKCRTLQERVQQLNKRFLQDKDSLKKQLEEQLREQAERQKKSIDELKEEEKQREAEVKKCNEKNSKRQEELTKISHEYKEKTKHLGQAHLREKEELERKYRERERELQQKYEESSKARDEQRAEGERKLAELHESYEEQRRVADEKMKKMTDEIETNMAELSHQYEEREKELKQQMEEERDTLERWLEEKHREELQQLRLQLQEREREREEEEKSKMEWWIKEREILEKHNNEMKVKEDEWREREEKMRQQIMEMKEELSRREEELKKMTEKQVPQRSWWGLIKSFFTFGVWQEAVQGGEEKERPISLLHIQEPEPQQQHRRRGSFELTLPTMSENAPE